jgi:hypothetical protein
MWWIAIVAVAVFGMVAMACVLWYAYRRYQVMEREATENGTYTYDANGRPIPMGPYPAANSGAEVATRNPRPDQWEWSSPPPPQWTETRPPPEWSTTRTPSNSSLEKERSRNHSSSSAV